MKKIIIAGMLLMSVAAIHATKNQGKLRSDAVAYNSNTGYFADTTPADTTRDTTDSVKLFSWNIVRDTVPSDTSDTTKPDSTLALAFNYSK